MLDSKRMGVNDRRTPFIVVPRREREQTASPVRSKFQVKAARSLLMLMGTLKTSLYPPSLLCVFLSESVSSFPPSLTAI